MLSRQAQRNAARREHAQPRRPREQRGDCLRLSAELLEVVEHEQQRALTQILAIGVSSSSSVPSTPRARATEGRRASASVTDERSTKVAHLAIRWLGQKRGERRTRIPVPPGPVNVTSLTSPRSNDSTEAISSRRPTSGVAGTGNSVRRAGSASGGLSAGSCDRIDRSSCCRAGPGSTPSSSTNRSCRSESLERVLLRPPRYRATICCSRSRSRYGWSAINWSRSGSSTACAPRARAGRRPATRAPADAAPRASAPRLLRPAGRGCRRGEPAPKCQRGVDVLQRVRRRGAFERATGASHQRLEPLDVEFTGLSETRYPVPAVTIRSRPSARRKAWT